jgi:hypothetical protein
MARLRWAARRRRRANEDDATRRARPTFELLERRADNRGLPAVAAIFIIHSRLERTKRLVPV